MKRRIYLVRHGQSEANAGGPHTPDTPLTQNGIKQAQFLAERAKKLPVDVVFSSDMLRARQTAGYIAEAIGKPLAESLELFAERRHVTTAVGLATSDPEAIQVEHIINSRFGEEGFRHGGEENFDDLKDRALRTLAYLDARSEQNILLVSHAVFVRMLLGVVLFGKDLTGVEARRIFHTFKTENTGVSVLEKNPDDTLTTHWRVFTWNDHAHLG